MDSAALADAPTPTHSPMPFRATSTQLQSRCVCMVDRRGRQLTPHFSINDTLSGRYCHHLLDILPTTCSRSTRIQNTWNRKQLQFTEFYYSTFDSDRASLGALYVCPHAFQVLSKRTRAMLLLCCFGYEVARITR